MSIAITEGTPSTEGVTSTTTGESAAVANSDSTTATAPVEGEGQGDAVVPAEGEPAAEQQAVPEQYAAFELPEGYTLTGDRLDTVTEFAKANGWTQEKAQEGISTYLQLRATEMEQQRGEWAVQSEDEFGKDFAEIASGAQRALVNLESVRPGITDRLDATNLGNHPDVLWVVNQLGQHLTPKKMEGMGNEVSGGGEKNIANRFYPNM